MGGGGLPLGPTEGRATVNVLSKDLDEGLALLTASLRGAAFQADRLKLYKDQALQNMKRRNDESAEIEDREWGALLRGEHDEDVVNSPSHYKVELPFEGGQIEAIDYIAGVLVPLAEQLRLSR